MKSDYQIVKSIQTLSSDLQGVFSSQDLRIVIQAKSNYAFLSKINFLISEGILTRFCKGYYISKQFSIESLSQKICPSSYISFEYILAKELLIGTQTKNFIRSVKLGKKKIYSNKHIKVVHLEGNINYFFAYSIQNGIKYACKEKAWLDTLYYYQKGQRYAFDIYSDINIALLDTHKLEHYLERYKNPKFKSFVRSFL